MTENRTCDRCGASAPCTEAFCCDVCGRHRGTRVSADCCVRCEPYRDGCERYAPPPPDPEWQGKESGSGVFVAIGWAYLIAVASIAVAVGLIVRFLKNN